MLSFLFDENLRGFPSILSEHGCENISSIFDHLSVEDGRRSIQDERIKEFAAAEQYVIVTRDFADFWIHEGFSVAVLCGRFGNAGLPQIRDWLLSRGPEIKQHFASAGYPSVVRVYPERIRPDFN